MRIGNRRPEPEEVFTPRKPLNERMYVERRDLERAFDRAIRSDLHIAIFGNSGCGKTWLYQKMLKDAGSSYITVDLAEAVTGGLDVAFRSALSQPFGWVATSKTEAGEGGINAIVKAVENRETQFTFADEPPFDKLVNELSTKKGRTKFIVFDNLEQVSSERQLMRALSSLIIRLDNERFHRSGVRFLFVGVVSDMKGVISGGPNATAIMNRIVELPEVKRLTDYEAQKLLRTGFFDLLRLQIDEEELVINSIIYYAGRNAQQIHHIGLQIACDAQDNAWRVDWAIAAQCILEWAASSLSVHRATVEERLNKTQTKVQRRNQVLLCMAKSYHDDFTASEVDSMVRSEFPESSKPEKLGIDHILRGLAGGDGPLLIRDENSGKYSFAHPKYRIAIRYFLKKSDEGDIIKNRVVDRPIFN